MHAVLPPMPAQQFGRIVNIGGTAGIRATPGSRSTSSPKTWRAGHCRSAEEVARMIVVLCSDVAAWVTGGGVSIDGGAAMGIVGG